MLQILNYQLVLLMLVLNLLQLVSLNSHMSENFVVVRTYLKLAVFTLKLGFQGLQKHKMAAYGANMVVNYLLNDFRFDSAVEIQNSLVENLLSSGSRLVSDETPHILHYQFDVFCIRYNVGIECSRLVHWVLVLNLAHLLLNLVHLHCDQVLFVVDVL